MCFFPIPNTNYDGLAYKYGIKEFDCGACPECLQKRSRVWALRCVHESRDHAFNCAVTLTYDHFMRDDQGRIMKDSLGRPRELPVDPNRKVDRRDVQLFIKRLRKFCAPRKIKVFGSSEYGSTTHRAHYHLLLFGVRFPDLVFYKKSNRGHILYSSAILTRLWGLGICTVDSKTVNASVARYCTKYMTKQRSEETFLVASQNIGLNSLLRHFNGRSYFIEGREYPVPRIVWQAYIMQRYSNVLSFPIDYRYVNRSSGSYIDPAYDLASVRRENYRFIRDQDPVYQRYLAYWKRLAQSYESTRLPLKQRIYALPELKYRCYKEAALICLSRRNDGDICLAPGSTRGRHYYQKLQEEQKALDRRLFFEKFVMILSLVRPYVNRFNYVMDEDEIPGHLRSPSRHYTASDTSPPSDLIEVVNIYGF